jgi:putative hydrolase of the HAD superfamily
MVKAVSFDVGETLLRPYPSFGELTVQRCREVGAVLPPGANARIEQLADSHFASLRRQGRTYSRSNEESRNAWLGLYRAFLHQEGIDENRAERVAEHIYATFVDPATYRLFDDARPVLTELRSRGFVVGVISNWETWLTSLLRVTGLDSLLDFRVVSGLVGYEKPDSRIFDVAIQSTGVAASDFLHVGDSVSSDVEGALGIGMRAILLDRYGRYPDINATRVQSLRELLDLPDFAGPSPTL